MRNIIYIKTMDDYNEIVKIKLPLFIKKIVFRYKEIFNIVSKKNMNEFNIWVLPFKENIPDTKLDKIIYKQIKKKNLLQNSRLAISNNLNKKIFDKYNIKYFNGNLAKKRLLFNILEYINNLQKKKMKDRDITILINENNEKFNFLIEQIALNSKTTKIVSKNIYKFRNIEKELLNEYGVPIQFSNSYRKSLLKAEIIINLDFSQIDMNEYNINKKAIIINTENFVKIKSKLFSGIIINSFNIKLQDKIRENFNKNSVLNKFDNLILYESILDSNYLKQDNKSIEIINLIGTNGRINNKEFENMS